MLGEPCGVGPGELRYVCYNDGNSTPESGTRSHSKWVEAQLTKAQPARAEQEAGFAMGNLQYDPNMTFTQILLKWHGTMLPMVRRTP